VLFRPWKLGECPKWDGSEALDAQRHGGEDRARRRELVQDGEVLDDRDPGGE
jgi:hypothetical protein